MTERRRPGQDRQDQRDRRSIAGPLGDHQLVDAGRTARRPGRSATGRAAGSARQQDDIEDGHRRADAARDGLERRVQRDATSTDADCAAGRRRPSISASPITVPPAIAVRSASSARCADHRMSWPMTQEVPI